MTALKALTNTEIKKMNEENDKNPYFRKLREVYPNASERELLKLYNIMLLTEELVNQETMEDPRTLQRKDEYILAQKKLEKQILSNSPQKMTPSKEPKKRLNNENKFKIENEKASLSITYDNMIEADVDEDYSKYVDAKVDPTKIQRAKKIKRIIDSQIEDMKKSLLETQTPRKKPKSPEQEFFTNEMYFNEMPEEELMKKYNDVTTQIKKLLDEQTNLKGIRAVQKNNKQLLALSQLKSDIFKVMSSRGQKIGKGI